MSLLRGPHIFPLRAAFGPRVAHPCLKLFASYLQGRQQYTVVGDYRSSVLEISQGIPQRSSLGPLLFALYVNELPKASAFNSTLFADDTVLSISSAKCIELQKLEL